MVTTEKLGAMGWSCSVTPDTTPAEDAVIVAEAKIDAARGNYLRTVEANLDPSNLDDERALVLEGLKEIAGKKAQAA